MAVTNVVYEPESEAIRVFQGPGVGQLVRVPEVGQPQSAVLMAAVRTWLDNTACTVPVQAVRNFVELGERYQHRQYQLAPGCAFPGDNVATWQAMMASIVEDNANLRAAGPVIYRNGQGQNVQCPDLSACRHFSRGAGPGAPSFSVWGTWNGLTFTVTAFAEHAEGNANYTAVGNAATPARAWRMG